MSTERTEYERKSFLASVRDAASNYWNREFVGVDEWWTMDADTDYTVEPYLIADMPEITDWRHDKRIVYRAENLSDERYTYVIWDGISKESGPVTYESKLRNELELERSILMHWMFAEDVEEWESALAFCPPRD